MERRGEGRSDVISMVSHACRYRRSVLQFEAISEKAPPYLGWRRVLELLGAFLDFSEIDESI